VLSVDELRTRAKDLVMFVAEPSVPTDAADVLPHLDSDDRNIRVAALRVLAFCDGPSAADGILRGLDDPMRRVRDVAAKSSVRFLDDPRVVERLRLAVEDDERGAGRPAMEILGGMHGLLAVEPVPEALAALAAQPRHRRQVLVALLRARTLTDDIVSILRDIVRDGTKEEAVLATRRLDGFRIERTELIGREARADADRAWGQVWYWIRAEQ
jgi:hypothetical protein